MDKDNSATGRLNDIALNPLTLSMVGKSLEERKFKNVMVLCGAGISVSAGIPDFRSPGTGLYDNLKKYNLPHPEAVFDVDFYRQNPEPFMLLAREIWPGEHSPTLTHCFIRLLEEKNSLLRCYTQNIDGLEAIVGVSPDKVMECHGNYRTASCIECDTAYDGNLCKNHILDGKNTKPPICRMCGGYVKPDIVFFGEGLPGRFGQVLRSDLRIEPDLLIVIGTSLMVTPVSNIPNYVDCPRVLLNREFVDGFTNKFTDVFEPGDCDESIRKLSRLAGWEQDLDKIFASSRLDKCTDHVHLF